MQADTSAATRVCGAFQVSITQFAGADGFSALMRRALALSRAEAPSLQMVSINADGTIQGLDECLAGGADKGTEAAVVLVGNLLTLLVIFIGEPLTLRLVAQARPDASSNNKQ